MYKLILKNLSIYKLKILTLLILNILISIVTLITPYITGKYIDLLDNNKDIRILIIFILAYIFMKLSQICFVYIYNNLLLKVKLKIIFDLTKVFTEHISNLPMSFISQKKSIYLSQRINTDLGKIIEFIFSDIYKVIYTISSLLIIVIFFMKINITMIFLAIISCIVYSYVFFIFTSKIRTSSYKFFEEENKFSASINEPYENIKNIKQNSILNFFLYRLQIQFDKLFDSKVTYGKISYLYKGCTDSIYAVASTIIMLICGIQVIQEKLSIGSAVSTTSYFSIMLTSLGSLLDTGQKYQEFKVSYNRLNEIFEMTEVKNGSICIDEIISLDLKSIKLNINNIKLFENFNYSFKQGNIYAIIGKNGKGKSTILDIIAGVIDEYEGEVLFNKINIEDIDMKNLKSKNISFMSQDIFILKDTVNNNILLDGINNQEDTIEQYIDMFNFKEYLTKYNKSIDNIIDDNLSGGEKQKIGLIRSAIKDSNLIILDEPTSALDRNTVKKLKEYILSIKSRKIIIMVSHDEELLDIADYKVNLNNVEEYI
ncbi:MAG: ATP-binding cassette domain-containing protein [Paraclostridium sp.]